MLKIALLDCAINKCSLFQATCEQKKTRGWHRDESFPSSLPLSFFLPIFRTPLSERLEQAMKNVAVLTEDGAFALFFPHPGGFDSSRAPILRNLQSKAQKNANTRGSARGELGAAGID